MRGVAATERRRRRARPSAGSGPGGNGSPRFLLYSHDALGLGHVRRNLVIAGALAERAPGSSILLATSAEHADSLGVPDGVDLLRLPAIRKIANGHYEPRRLPIPSADLKEIRAQILTAAVATFRPDVLLVDKHPLGVGGELEGALEQLWRSGGRAVLGLRDVLDAPAAVRNEWTPAHTRRVVDGYARVLVYGTDSVYDTVRLAGLPSELAARAQYCGYVTTPVASDARAARTIRGFESRSPNRPLVLATPGGGEDGKRLLDLFVEAAEGASWDGIAVTGPQLSSKAAGALRRRAASAGVAVRTFVPELPGWFGVVDAVVCMGGYNTLAEALIRGTPTVCVPRTAPRSEQLIRARALAERRLIGVVEPQRASGEALGEEIRRALAQSRTRIARAAAATLDFGGAAVAAETLLAEAAISREAAA